MLQTRRWMACVVLVLPLVLVAAACGDDDDDDAAGAATAEETVASEAPAASETTAAAEGTGEATTDDSTADTGAETDDGAGAVLTEPPVDMTVTEPLPSAPESKSVAFLVCPVEACETNVPYLENAIDALGWDLTTISLDTANPGAAFQQALDAGVDYIALTGVPLAAIEEQVAAAQEAGVPVFECFSTDDPTGEGNGLYAQCGGTDSVANTGGDLADWVIEDSGGAANVLFVTIRDFPILVAEEDAVAAHVGEACPDCTFDALSVTVADLGAGTIPQQVASYVQANPDTNYVWFSFSNLSGGVSEALDGAGLLDGVSLVGVLSEDTQLQEIVDGTNSAWTAYPNDYAMWVLADQMARVATDVWDADLEATSSVLPTWVVADPETAGELLETHGWHGPEGFEDSFKALWGV
jgi:ribose transport system substrate-binding protein